MRRCLALTVLSACHVVFPLDNETPDAPLDAPNTPNLVFVTSIPFMANIGLAGADAACRDLAAKARLDGDFVAWLSDSNTSVFDRLVGSRGWVRTDGVPVADRLDELLARGPRVPIAVSENMTSFATASPAFVRTGTTLAGPAPNRNCNDWSTTDAGTFGLSGELVAGGNEFTHVAERDCSEAQRLLCFERGKQVEVPASAATLPIVFVTSGTWLPNGGFAGADSLCTMEASGSLPGRTFRAVITDEGSLSARFPGQASTVFARPDGVVVGTVLAPGTPRSTFINVTASGAVNLANRVWTGSDRGLPSDQQACGNWSNTGAVGVVGAPYSSVATAFDLELINCTTPHPIYCAEVPEA
jgi:hypothetical protein